MLSAVLSLSACMQEDFGAASLEVGATSITLPLEGGSQTFTIKSTRDWNVTIESINGSDIEGITVSPSNGKPSHDAQTVTVYAEKNTGRNRTATIIVKASTESSEIKFSQKGELGNQMTVDEVISAPEGTEVTVKNALVYGVNTRGFVMGDETGLILVYDASEKIVEGVKVGDRVDIDGTTSTYGIAQVKPSKVTVLSSGNDVPVLDATVLTKDNIANADRSMVSCVEMEGIYIQSGNYHNVKIIGANVQGSISYPDESLGLDSMVGEVVKFRGFYAGGTTEYYYNILVTEILEHKPLDADLMTVEAIHAANRDVLVKAEGTVMGVHERGLVLGDETGVIYAYTNSLPDAKVGNEVTIIGLKDVNYGVHQIEPLKITVTDPTTETPLYGTPVDLTTLTKLNAYNINADKVATDLVTVKGTLNGLNITYAAENGVNQNKMPLMNYTIESYDFLEGKEISVTGYIISYNSTKTPPTVGILVVDVQADPYLMVESDELSVLADATSAEIKVMSNVAWTASTDAEWVTLSPASSSNDGTVSLTFTEYTETAADRTATITLTGEGLEPVVVTFTQRKAVEGGVLAEYVLTGWPMGTTGWDTNYTKRTIEFEQAVVVMESANKQTQTITDCPVTKGAPITIKMKEGKEMVYLTVYFKQWNTKPQTATLYASTDGGETFLSDKAGESSDFTLVATALPDGANAAKITFSSQDNQIGLAKIEIVYKDKE